MKMQLLKVAAFALLQALTVHAHEDAAVAEKALRGFAVSRAGA